MGTAVLLFDGECNLCDGTVRFVARRDRKKAFRFVPLQSEEGKGLLAEHRLDPRYLDSIVLIEGGRAWLKSDGALRMFGLLGGTWGWLAGLRVLPKTLRDWGYDLVARWRYRIFGKKNYCEI